MIILTSVGGDGAHTVAQDEASMVFGMLKEAIKLGGAKKIPPLSDIAGGVTHVSRLSNFTGGVHAD